MPLSNFKSRATKFNTGVGKCFCGQTLEFASEGDRVMKLRIHRKFCSNPPVAFSKIKVPKKAMTMREQQLNDYERIRKTSQLISIWINITIPERNQEATLYLQKLTSTLPIQMPSQVHLTGNTSHDYLHLQQFLSIYRFLLTTPYQLLCVVDHRVFHRVAIGNNTTHPWVIYLLEDNSLI